MALGMGHGPTTADLEGANQTVQKRACVAAISVRLGLDPPPRLNKQHLLMKQLVVSFPSRSHGRCGLCATGCLETNLGMPSFELLNLEKTFAWQAKPLQLHLTAWSTNQHVVDCEPGGVGTWKST